LIVKSGSVLVFSGAVSCCPLYLFLFERKKEKDAVSIRARAFALKTAFVVSRKSLNKKKLFLIKNAKRKYFNQHFRH